MEPQKITLPRLDYCSRVYVPSEKEDIGELADSKHVIGDLLSTSDQAGATNYADTESSLYNSKHWRV